MVVTVVMFLTVIATVVWTVVFIKSLRRLREIREHYDRETALIDARHKRKVALINNMDALLVERLREYARRIEVPVIPCAAASLRDWRTNRHSAGRAIRRGDRYEIRIREDHAGSPWVLAHELGHVTSWQHGGASSEAEADCEAEKVMLAVLTAEERAVVGPIVTGVLRSDGVWRARGEHEAEQRELARRFGAHGGVS